MANGDDSYVDDPYADNQGPGGYGPSAPGLDMSTGLEGYGPAAPGLTPAAPWGSSPNWMGVAKAVSQLQQTPQQQAAQAAANVPKATDATTKLASALTPVGKPAHPEAISNLLQFIAGRRNAYIQAGQSPAGGVPQMPLPSGLLGI